MAADEITSGHVARYLDDSPAKVQANRDIALLSHVFTKAVRWQLVAANPCIGVERNRERPRERYVTHDEFIAVFDGAAPVLQAMMALAYVTGQRESDLLRLRLRRAQVTPEGIHFRQGKTGKRLIVAWSPAMRTAIEIANTLPGEGVGSLFVVCRRDGQPYSADAFISTPVGECPRSRDASSARRRRTTRVELPAPLRICCSRGFHACGAFRFSSM